MKQHMHRVRVSQSVRVVPGILVAMAGAPCTLGDLPNLQPKFFPPVLELSSLNGANGFPILGEEEGSFFGYSVSSAGDINGDGFDDALVSARTNHPLEGYEGVAYVVFGGPAVGATAPIEIGDIDGANGFKLNGAWPGDIYFGLSVAAAGDVNGDGYDDIVVGHYTADRAYVVFGGPGVGATGLIDMSALSGADGFVIHGVDDVTFCGMQVSSAGDVDGDGVDDVLIGAPFASPNGRYRAGQAYVVFGKRADTAGLFNASFELGDLDGPNGFAINGIDPLDTIGAGSAGDFNGDGCADILINTFATGKDASMSGGAAYVVFGGAQAGASGSVELAGIDGTDGFILDWFDSDLRSGPALRGAGDLNGDGITDLVLSEVRVHPTDPRALVIFGGPNAGSSGLIDLSSLDGVNGFSVSLGGAFIRSCDGGGDINDDGFDDLAIGTNHGEVFVMLGGGAVGGSGSIQFADLSATEAFVVSGRGVAAWQIGTGVSTTADINGDGVDDMLLGSYYGPSPAGSVYVVFGRRARSQHLCPADVDGDAHVGTGDFTIMAAYFGETVEPGTLGDLTGDGVVNSRDFVILAGDFGCVP